MTAMNEAQLTKLKRPELQKLAKIHGVKANLKTDAIIAQLLERFPGGIPSSDVAEANHSTDGPPTEQPAEKADSNANPKPKGRKIAGMKKRPQPKVNPPKVAVAVEQEPAAPVSGPPVKKTKANPRIQPDNALGLVEESSSAARVVPKSIKMTIKVPAMTPKSAAAVKGANATRRSPPQAAASSVCTRTDAEKDDTQVPEIPEGLGPMYSISTGIPGSTKQRVIMAYQRHMVPNLSEAVSRAINGPTPLDPARITYDPPESDATFDKSTSTNHPVFTFPSHAPTDHTIVYTPSTPPRSRAPGAAERPPPTAPLLAPPAVLEPPRGSAADTEVVVRKMADISAEHKKFWPEVLAYGAKATTLASSVPNLRKLVRQERAERLRMHDYLAYWHAVTPGWTDDEIWCEANPTRIDESGREVEVLSDEEDPVIRQQFRRVTGAKATEILMRRRAYRRDSDEEVTRISEVFELTAERKLVLPGSGSKKRRCTPMDEVPAGKRQSKRARGADTPAKAAGTVPAASIPPLGAITEDCEMSD
ncbi:uncharacterized protein TRAVEDRAFT_52192 [Trametes versicolor FP-101664 SS1]|uniref:uncharacterized protein n=1 Tax=Trametes versicolor (strain FP-101664) TaxID=717944 RepID=UPI0004621905|nr:uncharacterized protein TRAVEDRAFT_52192 [Trametes versicolor FP-101664 SS1]EIW54487.1 hypothetical protein TRAVEDRAFT_52192 [Trametes versicolor FP-101664 SS1]